MDLRPVHEVRIPTYPTRREVLAGAAGMAMAGLCGGWRVFAAAEDGPTIVAPIFEHGEGRGSSGCIVVSPPVFLSEEEAMQIIREELDKHGIQLKEPPTAEDVRIPQRKAEYRVRDGGKLVKELTADSSKEGKTLKLDGVDSSKNVGVAFVSKKHYFDLGGTLDGSTVQVYDFKEVATFAASTAKKQGKAKIHLGMLYDPAVKVERKRGGRSDERNNEAKAESLRLLRQQAADFAAWLKEKKVVE